LCLRHTPLIPVVAKHRFIKIDTPSPRHTPSDATQGASYGATNPRAEALGYSL
jgi:hypothetical protein